MLLHKPYNTHANDNSKQHNDQHIEHRLVAAFLSGHAIYQLLPQCRVLVRLSYVMRCICDFVSLVSQIAKNDICGASSLIGNLGNSANLVFLLSQIINVSQKLSSRVSL